MQTKRLLSSELDEVASARPRCQSLCHNWDDYGWGAKSPTQRSLHGGLTRNLSNPANIFSPQVIKLKVTTHALRCIDKAGGLDPYILGLKNVEPGTKEHNLKERIVSARKERLALDNGGQTFVTEA